MLLLPTAQHRAAEAVPGLTTPPARAQQESTAARSAVRVVLHERAAIERLGDEDPRSGYDLRHLRLPATLRHGTERLDALGAPAPARRAPRHRRSWARDCRCRSHDGPRARRRGARGALRGPQPRSPRGPGHPREARIVARGGLAEPHVKPPSRIERARLEPLRARRRRAIESERTRPAYPSPDPSHGSNVPTLLWV